MRPYIETPEDRILTTRPFRVYMGRKIDIRWQGGWLTPEGVFHSVDYKRGITHETIAEEYGGLIQGSGSIMSQTPLIRIFNMKGWMRISYFEGASFCVELKGDFLDDYYDHGHDRQRTLLRFVRDYKGFDEYYINDAKYDTYQLFVGAIGRNEVEPVHA